jgi:hypothetical protein
MHTNGFVTDLQWPPPKTKIINSEYVRDMTIWTSDQEFFNIIDSYPSSKKVLVLFL